MGRSEVCAERRDGGPPRRSFLPPLSPRPPRRPRPPRSRRCCPVACRLRCWRAGLASAALLSSSPRCRRPLRRQLRSLVVEVQLDAVVEMGFLQHLAQFAGANLRVQLLFFLVFVQVAFVGPAVVARSVELFAFDDLLFHQPAAWRERRYRSDGGGHGYRDRPGYSGGGAGSSDFFFLPPMPNKAEFAGRQRIDMVRSAAIGFWVSGVLMARFGMLRFRLVGVGRQNVRGLGDHLGGRLVNGRLDGVLREVAVITRLCPFAAMLLLGVTRIGSRFGKERIRLERIRAARVRGRRRVVAPRAGLLQPGLR